MSTDLPDPQAPKDATFLRKVARFVANPATDWADLSAMNEDARDLDLEKSELKAMIERKRRNDFVRRREFDMLRKVRREGLSPEQLAALGSQSRLDDSEGRASDVAGPNMRGGHSVKAKIDAIEKQMVGGGTRPAPMSDDEPAASTSPAVMTAGRHRPAEPDPGLQHQVPTLVDDDEVLPALPPLPPDGDEAPSMQAGRNVRPAPAPFIDSGFDEPEPPPRAPAVAPRPSTGAVGSAAVVAAGLPPAAPARTSRKMKLDSPLESMEVGELVHDPELDPTVICFANADFDECEQTLTGLIVGGGRRHNHAETWLVLFDLFRATGQQHKFESLALDYVQRFNSSAPQWYSLPRMVADAVAAEKPKLPRTRGEIGWVCPVTLDVEAVRRLSTTVLQLPLPWVLDWSALKSIDAQAASELSSVMRQWANQSLEMRWLSGDRFFEVLGDLAPSGVRDADPALWMVRLDALRLANRPDQFDDLAIEYCITYEVSPPSWEPAKAVARIGGAGLTTQSPSLPPTDPAPNTAPATDSDSVDTIRVAELELAGQLVGDIAATLSRLNDEVGDATVIRVSCLRLIRVDFVAAGDLLNWVMTKRDEGRDVSMVETHRLVALFFGAMGVSEHASVRVRLV